MAYGTPDFTRIIDAFQGGRQLARQSYLQDLEQRGRELTGQALGGDANALKELGSVDPNAFMNVSKFTTEQKAQRLDELAAGAMDADTPEKWAAFVQRAAAQGHTLGPGETRESIINEAMGWKEKLAQSNADRSYDLQKSNADRSYGLQRDELTETKRYHDASLAAKDVPSGYRLNPDGSYSAVTGGPADPNRPGGAATADFKDITTVRKEIQDLPSYKSYSAAIPIYNTMVGASQRDSKAADLNLVYGLAKIYDPTSVVREGETVMVRDTASLPDWLVGTINGLNGGARLRPDTRTAMMQEAKSRIDAYKSAFDANLGQFKGMATRYSINEQDIMPVMPDVASVPTETGGKGDREPTFTPDEIDQELRKRGVIK